MWSYEATHRLDYYDTQVIVCAGYNELEGKLPDTINCMLPCIVLVTGPNARIGSGSGSTRNRTVATILATRKPWHTGNGPVLPRNTQHFNMTTVPPIKYLSSDRIMTWSVRRLCSSTRCVTSKSQICDLTIIHWVPIEYPIIPLKMGPFFTAIQWISVRSRIGKREGKERSELGIVRTDHVMTRWELKYLIGGKGVGIVKLEPRSSSNPAEKPLVHVLSG